MSGRFKERARDANPGPGAYTASDLTRVSTAASAPAFSMGGRTKDLRTNQTPGVVVVVVVVVVCVCVCLCMCVYVCVCE